MLTSRDNPTNRKNIFHVPYDSMHIIRVMMIRKSRAFLMSFSHEQSASGEIFILKVIGLCDARCVPSARKLHRKSFSAKKLRLRPMGH